MPLRHGPSDAFPYAYHCPILLLADLVEKAFGLNCGRKRPLFRYG
jgi:hypothetical protein